MVIWKKKANALGYFDFDSIRSRSNHTFSDLDGLIDLNGLSINSFPDTKADRVMSERLGEAIGLSVINSIHGLTEADWAPIPEQSGKHGILTSDYDIACSDDRFIVVECKGSSVSDNTKKNGLYNHYKSIKDKKKLSPPAALRDINSFNYGTITALDGERSRPVKCHLVDPPGDFLPLNPETIRVRKRLHFYYQILANILPRSSFLSAFSTRLDSLSYHEDMAGFDKKPLYRRYDEPFGGNLTNNKSSIKKKGIYGSVRKLADNYLVFFGIPDELISVVKDQNFDAIRKYKAFSSTAEEEVECIVTINQFNRMNLPRRLIENRQHGQYYQRFTLRGMVHTSPSGVSFGLLHIPEK